MRVESLESRVVFAAPDIVGLPTAVTLQAGAPLQIALDGLDTDNDNLTYTISVDPQFQSKLAAELRSGQSVRIEVAHQSSGAGDPAFTGAMVLKLFEDLAPRTTDHFIDLAGRNPSFFEDIIFHRVIDNFVIQGGDPTGTGTSGSDLPNFDDEFHADLQHTVRGLLSMAKSQDDTNDSQFFVTLAPTRHLDFNHSIFGLLVEGDSVLEQISNVAVVPNNPALPEHPTNNPRTRPESPVTMTDVTVFQDMQNGVFTLKTLDNNFTGTVNVNVTVSDGTSSVTKTIAVNVVADTVNNAPFLGPIAPIVTTANVPTTFQIPRTEVDTGQTFYMDRDDFTDVFGIPESLLPPVSPNLSYSVDLTTGVLTVTPMNGASGVFPIIVGVAQDTNGFDWQFVPVYVNPAAPTAPDLQPASDTGGNTNDNATRLNNADSASRLRFNVGNVVPGAEVTLFAGAVEIGRATVPTGASTIEIITNGTAALPNGTHAITVVQTLNDQVVKVGNLDTTTDLASAASAALTLTVDATAPVITSTAPTSHMPGTLFTYNVEASEEGANGFVYSLLEAPTGATIDPASGLITWNAPQSGTHAFRVQGADLAGNKAEQQFSVSLNSAPVLMPIDDRAAPEGQLISFTATATDNDLPGDTLTFSLLGTPPSGAAINPTTGEFTWTPTAAQAPGMYTITVQVMDAAGSSDTEDFTVTVADPIAPVIPAIADQTASEQTPFTLTVTATDDNLPNDDLTFSLSGTAPAGMTINADTGVISWTPNEDQGGSVAVVTVRVTDSFGLFDEEIFDITVSESNTPPVLADITDRSVNAGATLTLTATATDADLPMQALTFSLLAGAPAGAAINTTTGEITWTPGAAVGIGPHSFTVRVTDALGGSDEETFQVTVNQAPAISAIADQMIDEGQAFSLTATATDPNPGDTFTFSLLPGAPASMTIDPNTGVITWSPEETDGGATFPVTVRVTDAGGLSSEDSFDVVVNEVNSPPVLGPIGDRRINSGEALTFNAVATDSDVPGQNIIYSLAAGAPAGAMIDAATGEFSWMPTTQQGFGPFEITIRASDGTATDEETITVIVNTAPQLNAVADQTVDEGALLSLTIVATDANLPNDTLTYTLVGTVPPGATINPTTGVFTWTPTEAQGPGMFPITVRVVDLNGLTDEETFDVQVNEVTSAPVLSTIGNQTVAEGQELIVAVSATDADLPAQTLQFAFNPGDLPTSAFTFDPATGMLTLMPGEDLGGRTFMGTITVTDSTGQSDSETFQITVTEANALPVIPAISNQTVNEGETLTVTVTATDADQPAQTITFSLGTGAPAGASINPTTGVFTWTPTEGQGPGMVTITVRATDSLGGVGTQSMQVTVAEVNQAPVFNPVGPQTARQGATTRFFATATDPDLPANTLTYSLVNPLEGMSINAATGEVTWNVPLTQPEGPMWLTVRVTDAGGLTDEVTIDMVVQRFDPAALFAATNLNSPGAVATTADNIAADLTRNLLLPAEDEPEFVQPPIENTPIAASIDRQQAAVDVEMIRQLEEEAEARERSSQRIPLDGATLQTNPANLESRAPSDGITPAAQNIKESGDRRRADVQPSVTLPDRVIESTDKIGGWLTEAGAELRTEDAADMTALLWADAEDLYGAFEPTGEEIPSANATFGMAAAIALPGIVAEIHRRRKKVSTM
jgi:cyclophilin family peptidyl-prolyl cis-trans isomerase